MNQSRQIGAGEHLVAAQIIMRGGIAAITQLNPAGIGIMASSPDGCVSVNVRVKIARDGNPEWMMHKRDESIYSTGLYYVMVHLPDPDMRPNYYIVPSRDIVQMLRKQVVWTDDLNLSIRSRIIELNDDTYLEKWEQLPIFNPRKREPSAQVLDNLIEALNYQEMENERMGKAWISDDAAYVVGQLMDIVEEHWGPRR